MFQPGNLEGEQASAPLQNLAEDENTLIPLANMVRHIYIHHPKSLINIIILNINFFVQDIGTAKVTEKKESTNAQADPKSNQMMKIPRNEGMQSARWSQEGC